MIEFWLVSPASYDPRSTSHAPGAPPEPPSRAVSTELIHLIMRIQNSLGSALSGRRRPKLIFQNHFKKRPPTIELKTNFLYPTKPGKVIGYGQVVKSGKNIAFLEGRLEQNNRTVVTATSTCVIVDMPQVNLKKMIGGVLCMQLFEITQTSFLLSNLCSNCNIWIHNTSQ